MATEKITPLIELKPAPMQYGEALALQHLNPKAVDGDHAEVVGTFVCAPALGTVLEAGLHNVTVRFVPAEGDRYSEASAQSAVECSKAIVSLVPSQSEIPIPYGSNFAMLNGKVTCRNRAPIEGSVSVEISGQKATAAVVGNAFSVRIDTKGWAPGPYPANLHYSGSCNAVEACADTTVKVEWPKVKLRAVLEAPPDQKNDSLERAFAGAQITYAAYQSKCGQLTQIETKMGQSPVTESHFTLKDHLATEFAFAPAPDSLVVPLSPGRNAVYDQGPIYVSTVSEDVVTFHYRLGLGGLQIKTELCLGNGQTMPLPGVEVALLSNGKVLRSASATAPNVAEFTDLPKGVYNVKVTRYPLRTDAHKPIVCVQPEIRVWVDGAIHTQTLYFESCKESPKVNTVTATFVQGVCREPLPANTSVEVFSLDGSQSHQKIQLAEGGKFSATLAPGKYALVPQLPQPGSLSFRRIQETIQVDQGTSDLGVIAINAPNETAQATHFVKGVLRSRQGAPVSGQVIKLIDANTNEPVCETKANHQGEYSLPCGQGSYYVLAGSKRILVPARETVAVGRAENQVKKQSA